MDDAPYYREAGPDRLPAVLRDLVECAWHARVPAARPDAHRQRVLPDGCMDLLLIGDRIVVAGPDTSAHVADQPPGSAVTGLRFRTGTLPGLLGVPADELRDRRVPLIDVLSDARRVPPAEMLLSGHRRSPHPGRSHLGAGGPGAGGLAALVGTAVSLLGAAEAGTPAERLPRPVVDALARGMPAAELADRLGVTARTLQRRCRATLGYGPSVARRVLRFRVAVRLLYDGVAPAEVAARAGYADQPHLSREVRALSGLSPTVLARSAAP